MTTDSVDRLAGFTGQSREALLGIWEEVKANTARLNACPRHDFVAEQPGRLGSKWRCSACSGTVDGSAAHWYRQGLTHGGAHV